jgi:hypothetical protein
MDSSSFLRFGPLLGASLLIVGLIEAKRSVEEARRKSAAQVERSEAYLAEAQKLSRSGSWASEADSLEPTYWSAEMFRIVGLPLADDPPAVEEFAALFPPEDWTRLMEMFKAARHKKTTLDGDIPLISQDGTTQTNASAELTAHIAGSITRGFADARRGRPYCPLVSSPDRCRRPKTG